MEPLDNISIFTTRNESFTYICNNLLFNKHLKMISNSILLYWIIHFRTNIDVVQTAAIWNNSSQRHG